MLSKLTLRLRLTCMTGFLLVLLGVGISLFTYWNAENVMFRPFQDFQVKHLPIKPYPDFTQIPPDAAEFKRLMEQARLQFIIWFIVIMLFFIVLGTMIMYYFSGKVLKPVTSLSKQITNINEQNLDQHLKQPIANDEIGHLTVSFNTMLTKLSLAFSSQKRFAQKAAHELKTPLTGMLTTIEVFELEDNPSIEECLDVVKTTKHSTLKLIDLVEKLLKIDVLNAKEMGVVHLRKVIDDIVEDLICLIEQKNITIQIEGQLDILADPTLIKRLFFNIILNAIRYNKQDGQILIKITTHDIEIKDTGIGIEEKYLEHIFDPYYVIKENKENTGLGLTIVKEILTQYQLPYHVTSTLGISTTFWIDFTSIIHS